eukprot:5616561-Alexandrium_andersonii.AAC.1
MASMATTCTLCGKRDPDPGVAIVVRRLVMARRIWWRQPHEREAMQQLLQAHCDDSTPGTCGQEGPGPSLAPRDPTDPEAHRRWPPDTEARGPISLLLFTLARIGCAMDAEWRIHQ